jgi:hypothetical protein
MRVIRVRTRRRRVLAAAALLLATTFVSTASAQYTFSNIQFPGATSTMAQGINDQGKIVGHYLDGTDGRWHGLIFQNGVYTTLDYPGVPGTFLLGINSQSDIVGYYCFGDCGYDDHFPFLYAGGTFSPLPQPAGSRANNTVPKDINDQGVISGNFLDPCFCKFHGFTYSGGPSGTYTTVDRPGFAGTSVMGLNDAGAVVGTFSTSLFSEGGTDQGFLKSDSGTYSDVLVGDHSYPADVNALDQVVGQYVSGGSPYHSYMYDGGVVTSFDPPDTGGGSGAFGINSTGTVVGWYVDGGGALRGYSASPIYNLCLLYDSTRSVKSGATIPIKLQLCDSNGQNLSSASIVVHATNVVLVSTSSSSDIQNTGNSNPDANFRFDNGAYIFNLKTTGLSGSYVMNFTIDGGSQTYSAPFQVR